MNLRLASVTVHRWTGLTVGLLVLISAITGAGLAFRPSLDPVVYPAQFHGLDCPAPLPLDALIASAKASHPKGAIDYIRIHGPTTVPALIRFGNKDTLYVDRCSGRITTAQSRYEGVFGVLEWVHRAIYLPNGGVVMGFGALAALILMAGLGVYIWWPRAPRRFVQGFQIDRRLKGPIFTWGLHKTVGAWAALLLTVSSATAIPNAFDPIKAWMIGADAEARPHSTPPAAQAKKLPIEAAMATVRTMTPEPREVLIHLARKPKDPVEIFVIEAKAPHANARTYLYLDAYSGKVLKFEPYGKTGWGSRLYYWMLSVHTGQVGGLFGQLLLFLGAAAVPVLAYTGASSYLRRRFRKPVRRTA